MPTLREFQQRFVASLFAGGEPDATLAHCIEANGLAAARRLSVYRNNLLSSLTDSLGDTYPAVRALVGEGFFRMVVHRYIHAHPSRSGDLHEFGEHFASFLGGVNEAASLPWIEDLARLEWSYHRVFHAAEETPLDVAALSGFDAAEHERLVLRLHPASTPLRSRYPLTAIWRLGIHGNSDSADVNLDAGPEYLLVARRDLVMAFQSLSDAEFAFIDAMAAGLPLVDCASAAFGVDRNFDVGACLQRQFALGNVTGAALADEGP